MLVLDLTRPLDESTPVYSDSRGYSDPPTRLSTWVDVGDESTSDQRSPFRVTHLEISLHTGTHVDAPAHFTPGGMTIDALPVASLVGRAVVVDLSEIRGAVRAVDLAEFEDSAGGPGVLPLILMPEAGRLAADAVTAVGRWGRPLICVSGAIDGDDPDCPATAALLKAGICLAVDLSTTAAEVLDGDLLVVAPLALRGVEGAPARILAIRLPSPTGA